jgi:hypothetical protein
MLDEDEARRQRSIAWTRTASGFARPPGGFKLDLSVEEQEQRDKVFLDRRGITVEQARGLNALDLYGPPAAATRKLLPSHSYLLTHPVTLTQKEKERIKLKLVAPVVRRHSGEPSRRA